MSGFGISDLPLYDALAQRGTIRHVLTRHEQGAGFVAQGMARATGLAPERTAPVIAALAEGGVLHCDGDPCSSGCRYDPDRVLALEVDRFMRATDSTSARLQSGVDRYRDRFGHS